MIGDFDFSSSGAVFTETRGDKEPPLCPNKIEGSDDEDVSTTSSVDRDLSAYDMDLSTENESDVDIALMSTDSSGFEACEEHKEVKYRNEDVKAVYLSAKNGDSQPHCELLNLNLAFKEALREGDLGVIEKLLSWGADPLFPVKTHKVPLDVLAPLRYVGNSENYQAILAILQKNCPHLTSSAAFKKLFKSLLVDSKTFREEPDLLAVCQTRARQLLEVLLSIEMPADRRMMYVKYAIDCVLQSDDDELLNITYRALEDKAQLNKGVYFERLATADIKPAKILQRIKTIFPDLSHITISHSLASVSNVCHQLSNASDEAEIQAWKEIIQILIQVGADPKQSSASSFFTILENRQMDLLEFLINCSKEFLKIKDADGNNCLNFLVSKLNKPNNDSVCRLYRYLCDKGADQNDKNDKGQTACMRMVAAGMVDVLKELDSPSINYTLRDSLGCNILHLAATQFSPDLFDFCYSKCQDVDACTTQKQRPIHIAIDFHNIPYIERLKQKKVDMSRVDIYAKNAQDATAYELTLADSKILTAEELSRCFFPLVKDFKTGFPETFIHLFIQSDLKSSRKVFEGIKERLPGHEVQLEKEWQKLVCWSSIITRYPDKRERDSVKASYFHGDQQSYYLSQKKYGEYCLEAVYEALAKYQTSEWNIWEVIQFLTERRNVWEMDSTKRKRDIVFDPKILEDAYLQQIKPQNGATSWGGCTPLKGRYAHTLSLVNRIFKKASTGAFKDEVQHLTHQTYDRYVLLYTDQNSRVIKLTATHFQYPGQVEDISMLSMGDISWVHTHPQEYPATKGPIEELESKIKTLKFSSSQDNTELMDCLADMTYLLQNVKYTPRGFSAIPNMVLLLFKLHTGTPCGPIKHEFAEVACVAISTPRSIFKSMFPNLFDCEDKWQIL